MTRSSGVVMNRGQIGIAPMYRSNPAPRDIAFRELTDRQGADGLQPRDEDDEVMTIARTGRLIKDQ